MPLQIIGVPLDVLALTREAQSQHGVRNEDFARYHRYLTNRIATLRRQTKTQQIPATTKAAAAAAKKRAEAAGSLFHRDLTVESVMGMAEISTGLLSAVTTTSDPALLKALSVTLSLCPSRRSKASSAAIAANSGSISVVGGSLLTPNDNCSFVYLPPTSTTATPAAGEDDAEATLRRQQQFAVAASAAAGKAAGGKYFEVLVLSAERCWAEYEELCRPPVDAPATPVTSAQRTQGRKRLNKAVKWCEKLEELAQSLQGLLVTSADDEVTALATLVEYVVASISGYVADMKAKCAAAHNDNVLTADSLIQARSAYLTAAKALSNPKLLSHLPTATASSSQLASEAVVSLEQTHALLLAKIGELDDRVILVESTTNKDDVDAQDRAAVSTAIAAFRASPNGGTPPTFVIASSSVTTSSSSSTAAATLTPSTYITLGGSISWFGGDRKTGAVTQIPVHNLRVKACLRQAGAYDPTAIARKLTALPAGSKSALPPLIALPCQRRINDLYDRTIHCLNDALSHARQEGRSVGGADRKTASQVLHLYLQYQIARKTADRALFLLEVLMRRLTYTLNFIRTKAATSGPGSNVASLDGTRISKGYLKIKGATRAELVQGNTEVRFYTAAGRCKVPVVSPTEMSHIYDIAIRSLEEMSHLPGVEGGGAVSLLSESGVGGVIASIEDLIAEQTTLCKIGKLACAGAAWQFIGVAPAAAAISSEIEADVDSVAANGIVPTAELAIPQAIQTLTRAAQAAEAATMSVEYLQLERIGMAVSSAKPSQQLTSFYGLTLADSAGLPTVLAPKSLTALIDMQLMQLTIIVNASSSSSRLSTSGAHNNSGSFTSPASVFGGLGHLKSITKNNNTSSGDSLLVPCFPAKPMPLVPKPVSIDIASIFITVPRGNSSTKTTASTKSSSSATTTATAAPKKSAAGGGGEKGGWLGGWGWKGSK